jgi:hypothetical protein
MTETNFRELCAELFAIVENEYSGSSCLAELRIRTATALAQPEPTQDLSQLSDGYHTFAELYEHRHALCVALMRAMPRHCWFSLRHADGERCFGGNNWFIVGIEPPGGNSVTYHLPAELYPLAQATGATELAKGRPWDGHTASDVVLRLKEWAAMAEPQGPTVIGPEWQPCVKLPITVHVREQRPGETHNSTREGITPLRPDDLIMRGVQGEEYPIGRELFNQTYRMGAALAQPEPQGPTDEELDELFIDIDQGGEALNWRPYARAVLARWGRPAIEPVLVSERLPGPEDCDANGIV